MKTLTFENTYRSHAFWPLVDLALSLARTMRSWAAARPAEANDAAVPGMELTA